MVVRRMIGGVVGNVAVAAMLSGCLLPLDSAGTDVRYRNNSNQVVYVIIEGLSNEYPRGVPSGGSYPESLGECQGTGIRVETESGELIGRVKAQACPHWTLTINKDGSLDYVKD